MTASRASDVAFSDAVKTVQEARGSRGIYSRVDFEREVSPELESFLATIDTAFLATASVDGQPYVQHRGGPRGFLRVTGENTIAFADFAGNKQYVSTGNLAENDRVCLIAIDYARRARVKIWGRAHVVPATPELAALVADPSYRARVEQVVVIDVEAWDANCPQHIPRLVRAEAVVDLIRRRRRAIRRRRGFLRRSRSSPTRLPRRA